MDLVIQAVNGFMFGAGFTIAIVVIKILFHVGVC